MTTFQYLRSSVYGNYFSGAESDQEIIATPGEGACIVIQRITLVRMDNTEEASLQDDAGSPVTIFALAAGISTDSIDIPYRKALAENVALTFTCGSAGAFVRVEYTIEPVE